MNHFPQLLLQMGPSADLSPNTAVVSCDIFPPPSQMPARVSTPTWAPTSKPFVCSQRRPLSTENSQPHPSGAWPKLGPTCRAHGRALSLVCYPTPGAWHIPEIIHKKGVVIHTSLGGKLGNRSNSFLLQLILQRPHSSLLGAIWETSGSPKHSLGGN